MKKKIISYLLIAAMALGVTACGSGSDNKGTESGTTDTAGDATPAAGTSNDGETYNIRMQIATFGQEFTGLADV